MNWQAVSFDWNQVRAFLATAEEGSLSAAARALRLTQPTLSRQVSALEQDLGVTLFERGHRSMALTATGLDLLEHVRAMGDAATRVSLTASGRSQSVEGQVSLTTTNTFAVFHLPPILARIRAQAPGIEIEVIAANEVRDLRRREADIAIRHARPEQADLIGKLIGGTTAHLYASEAYLDRIGRPTTPADLADADFIGFEYPEKLLPQFEALGVPVTRDHFKVYSASGLVYLSMMRQGLGVGFMTRADADLHPDLEMVLPELPPIDVPVWLVTHRELRTSRRIRLVFDLIAEYAAEL
ncbi:MAG: LysR family transcriptional regulator [Gammaproteobacteria bacterium]|nr:LysR family transcriptional regulator [Gammaproteobacteria bacterium]